MMTLEQLYKEKETKLEQIRSMKKPKQPKLSKYFNRTILIIMVVILIAIAIITVLYVQDQSRRVLVIPDIVLFVSLIVIAFVVNSNYTRAMDKYKDKIGDWTEYKNNLYIKTEKEYNQCIIMSKTYGIVITPDEMNEMQKPAPKCPTCGSTNLKTISGLRRDLAQTAFGVANPTARAQFECKDCGYKW